MFNNFYYFDIIKDFINVFKVEGRGVAGLDLTHHKKSYSSNVFCKNTSKQTKFLTNFKLI